MPEQEITEVSRLLLAWRDGDASALDRLVPLVYDQLHELAQRHLRGERDDHTLQTTALINEAYLRLVGTDIEWAGRAHFMAVAARTMRRILVDHARSRQRGKRGAGAEQLSLDQVTLISPQTAPHLVALDEALDRLATMDERQAQIVDLHYFGGFTYEETATMLGVSAVTVHRDLRLATAWLYREINDGPDASD